MSLKQSMIVFLVTLTAALPVAAQMGMGMGMGGRVPTLSGIWHPVVGTGASYDVTKADGTKMPFEILIVGKEDVDGKPAYWMEMSMVDARTSSTVCVKLLTTVNENHVISSRMIMQMPGVLSRHLHDHARGNDVIFVHCGQRFDVHGRRRSR